jgi:hypothetical protein
MGLMCASAPFLPFAKLETGHSEILVSLKTNPAYGGEPKRPRIWSFLAEGFRMAFCFFSESLWLSKCAKLANLIKNPPRWLRGAIISLKLTPRGSGRKARLESGDKSGDRAAALQDLLLLRLRFLIPINDIVGFGGPLWADVLDICIRRVATGPQVGDSLDIPNSNAR